jgi:hypothetical protein
MSEKHDEVAAYHESGHIVFAYFVGFGCTGISLDYGEAGDAWTKMDYGEDTLLATAILNYDQHPEIFDGLPSSMTPSSPGLAHRLCSMICGGPITEAFFTHGIEFKGDLGVEMGGPDLQRVRSIDLFLAHLLQASHRADYVQYILMNVATLTQMDEFWNAIEQLTKAILAEPKKTLTKAQIEDVLNQCGFMTFLEAQRQ